MKRNGKIALLCLLCLVLCSSDKNIIVTWNKYDLANNPDVQRLSLWEVNPDTQWVRTISDWISPLDTTFNFIVPDADAYGTKYYTMIAVDTAENRSGMSNIASITFKPGSVKNLQVKIQ